MDLPNSLATSPEDRDGTHKADAGLVSLKNVSMSFSNANGLFVEVLRDFTLDVPQGQILGIIGPSGCGKTTILKLIAGLQTPTSGSVLVNAVPSSVARENRTFSFMFQKPVLLPWLNVWENVQLPRRIAATHLADDQTHDLITMVGLSGFEKAFPHQLSGGMQARVALARSLASNPKVLLMDEPFGSLDALTRSAIQGEFLKIIESARTTVVLVTHSVEEAVYISDRALVLSDRPAKIIMDVPIQLPRPRYRTVKDNSSFIKYRTGIEERILGKWQR